MANRARYQLIEIRNANGVPCFVAMQRDGESFVDIAWQCRTLVDNPLMRWLRSLSKRPKARVLLGTGVQLNLPTARALVGFAESRLPVRPAHGHRCPICALAAAQSWREH